MCDIDIKTIRDKLNGSEQLGESDDLELLQEQWNEIHQKMEDEKINDDSNFLECK